LVCLVCLVSLVCLGGRVHAEQPDKPDNPDELIDWDVLPNGLIKVQYDRSGDGVPDHFTLHQVTWSGWTAQEIREIEAQARVDGQWVFVVEYDEDRYVYLTEPVPLFVADDAEQDGLWTTLPATCHTCAR
jgi:hypothetical protein